MKVPNKWWDINSYFSGVFIIYRFIFDQKLIVTKTHILSIYVECEFSIISFDLYFELK